MFKIINRTIQDVTIKQPRRFSTLTPTLSDLARLKWRIFA